MVFNVKLAESTKRGAIKNAAADLERIGIPVDKICQMIVKRAKEMDVSEPYVRECLPPKYKDQAQREVRLGKNGEGEVKSSPAVTKQIKVTKKKDIKFLRQENKILRQKVEDLEKEQTQAQQQAKQLVSNHNQPAAPQEESEQEKPQKLTITEQDNIDLKNKLADLTEKCEKEFNKFRRMTYLLRKETPATDEELATELRDIIKREDREEMEKTRLEAKNMMIVEAERLNTYHIDKYSIPLLRQWVQILDEKLKDATKEYSNLYEFEEYIRMFHDMMRTDPKLLKLVVDKIEKEVKRQQAKGYRHPKNDDKQTPLQYVASNVCLNINVSPMINKMMGDSGDKPSDRNAILSVLDMPYESAIRIHRKEVENRAAEKKRQEKSIKEGRGIDGVKYQK